MFEEDALRVSIFNIQFHFIKYNILFPYHVPEITLDLTQASDLMNANIVELNSG